ncbi:hypothetical protein PoMZ_06154 [Pyricularia oryzae]|uniref:Uncharacterized protein n=1 Tax=Pyricularia oryzae TaxID=318829 RepID=A0A4P7NRM0_PYROR|nr:hypothetical protein PoMZ_06154 [Pyricularia oryzae]
MSRLSFCGRYADLTLPISGVANAATTGWMQVSISPGCTSPSPQSISSDFQDAVAVASPVLRLSDTRPRNTPRYSMPALSNMEYKSSTSTRVLVLGEAALGMKKSAGPSSGPAKKTSTEPVHIPRDRIPAHAEPDGRPDPIPQPLSLLDLGRGDDLDRPPPFRYREGAVEAQVRQLHKRHLLTRRQKLRNLEEHDQVGRRRVQGLALEGVATQPRQLREAQHVAPARLRVRVVWAAAAQQKGPVLGPQPVVPRDARLAPEGGGVVPGVGRQVLDHARPGLAGVLRVAEGGAAKAAPEEAQGLGQGGDAVCAAALLQILS